MADFSFDPSTASLSDDRSLIVIASKPDIVLISITYGTYIRQ